MWGFLHFARLASRVGKRLPRPDIVLASHTPLTIGLAGMELAQHFQIPFVFEVRDLWPQALINLGAIRNPAAIWWLRRMERRIYRAADHIIALSPGMKEGIVGTGVPEDRVTMIPNASDLDLFRPDLDRQFGRERLGLGDRFAAIYFGAMGYANGLEYIIEAAEMLQNQGADGIVFVLHGDGKQRHWHEHQVREKGLTNVIFSDPVPDKHVVAQLVSACDVGLTVYRADKEHTWSPNKMFDALAAGKPVIVNVPGWLSQIIEENRCGRGVSPECPAELARVLLQFSRDPEGCQQMGVNARSLAEREFARDRLAANLETVLLSSIESYNKTDQVSVRGV
jgi:glycosyltransferase involved in cell wall biosynthesis